MNGPIDRFLTQIDGDLQDVLDERTRAEQIRELRHHLEESASEMARQGEPDPEEAAVREFGGPKAVQELVAAEGKGLNYAERRALLVAAATVALPVVAEIGMDASSFLTGSDSATFLIGIPMAVGAAFFLDRCRAVRRILWGPIAFLVLAGFLVSSGLGGFTQAVSPEGTGTRARGTALQRMRGLEREGLSRNLARSNEIARGRIAFQGDRRAVALDQFRTKQGFLVPRTPDLRSIPAGTERWTIDELRWESISDYSAAQAVWARDGALVQEIALRAVDGDRQEIAELRQVVAAPWWPTVVAQNGVKTSAAFSGMVALLVLNAIGSGIGVLQRKRRRPGVAS